MRLETTPALENPHSSELPQRALSWLGSSASGQGVRAEAFRSFAFCHILCWGLCSAARSPGLGRWLRCSSGAGALGTPIQQVQCWGVWMGVFTEGWVWLGQQGCSSNREPGKGGRWGRRP